MSQPNSSSVLSARSPNTSRNPSRIRAHGEGSGAAGSGWLAALGWPRRPRPISRPLATNVAASTASELRTPMKATATPPPTAPSTSPVSSVVCSTAVPST
jgi:hypothetical protein